MSYFRTGDPLADFDCLDMGQARQLAKRPKCCECGEHIQSEKCYRIHGDVYCSDCIESFAEDVTDNEEY